MNYSQNKATFSYVMYLGFIIFEHVPPELWHICLLLWFILFFKSIELHLYNCALLWPPDHLSVHTGLTVCLHSIDGYKSQPKVYIFSQQSQLRGVCQFASQHWSASLL